MSYATYGPRVSVHRSRHGPVKSTRNLWIVLHTSEGGELPSSAEALGAFMGTPATASNVASYNVVFDTDRVLPAVPYGVVPYAASGGNAQGVHGCFPGRAGQTREQWLDAASTAMIRQAARWIVDVSIELGLPIRRLTWQQVQLGIPGVCDHYDVTRAFKKSTHTDVGPGFPWDFLFAEIELLTHPAPPTQQPKTIEVGDMRIEMTDRRIFDSRSSGPAGLFAVQTGLADIAGAVEVTVTAIAGRRAGFMGVNGGTSFINFTPGAVVANSRTFPVQADGTILMGATDLETGQPTPINITVDLIAHYPLVAS